MGNSSSTGGGASPASNSRGLGARARLDELNRQAANPAALTASLKRSGRYFSVDMPNGSTVHLLGVFPCSSKCEEEAHALVTSLKPSHLYVDLVPEWAAAIQDEVAAGRVGEWQIPDTTPGYRMYPGAGILGSILIRNQLADSDILGLLGAEWFGPFKVALAAARKLANSAANNNSSISSAAGNNSNSSAAADGGANSSSAGPKILAFPYSMHYNNGELIERPSAFTSLLVGNNSFTSDAVHALCGNNAAIMAGEKAEAEFTAQIPPAGYFTRQQVNDLQVRPVVTPGWGR